MNGDIVAAARRRGRRSCRKVRAERIDEGVLQLEDAAVGQPDAAIPLTEDHKFRHARVLSPVRHVHVLRDYKARTFEPTLSRSNSATISSR